MILYLNITIWAIIMLSNFTITIDAISKMPLDIDLQKLRYFISWLLTSIQVEPLPFKQ